MKKQFTMSMFATGEDLYKAKAEYYEQLCEELAQDAKQYCWWKENRPVTLLTSFYGNGCINKTVEGMEVEITTVMNKETK